MRTGAPALSPRAKTVALRDAAPQDDLFLRALYAARRAAEIAAWGFSEAQAAAFLPMQFMARRAGYGSRHPGAEDRIVLVDGMPAGRLLVDRSSREIRVVDIALLPDFQRQGIGDGLIRGILAEAREAGVPVRLSVLAENPAARLYESLGFRPVSEAPPYRELEWSAAGSAAPVRPGSSTG